MRIILTHKKLVVILFLVFTVVCVVLQSGVSVNHDMADYLPEQTQSTKAVELMAQEFTQAVPNAQVMLVDVTIFEVLETKISLAAVDGVSGVMWLDDLIDLKQPIEMADTATVESYYKNDCALIDLTIANGDELRITEEIYEIIGAENSLSGEAVDLAATQELSSTETRNAIIFIIPIIILVLLLTTESWLEPLLFLSAIGVSVLMNMGTTLFFGEVSFITKSVSPILQLAVSLDYAIFLLHCFAEYREKTEDTTEAMLLAMRRSLPSIAASALTTLFGFLALTFMEFKIGSDLGFNLVKGIIFSYICVTLFLPAMTLCCIKLVDKTKHRRIFPKFSGVSKVVSKAKIPVLVLVLLVLVPSFLAQKSNQFTYGSGEVATSGRVAEDKEKIKNEFGETTELVLLVPRGAPARELELSQRLGENSHVTAVVSYATSVGAEIPPEYLDESIISQFYSDDWARIILYTDTESEGDVAFAVVEEVSAVAHEYYDEIYTCGRSASLYDVKQVVEADNKLTSMLAIIAIGLVLLITFKSLAFPVILVLTIEAAIWINMSVPYFQGASLSFFGYLVLNTVQLGATVDYAILYSDHFRENRRLMPAKQAARSATNSTFGSILVSASILTICGFILNLSSTNDIVKQIGLLLGRGTILSFILVVFFLPTVLTLCDRFIARMTLNYPNKKAKENAKQE